MPPAGHTHRVPQSGNQALPSYVPKVVWTPTGMFVMMYYATTRTGVPATQLRNLTPSQVMDTLTGYNGDGVYGRKRMALYYLIQRWREDFR
jgi:hypothetical protein